MPQTSVHIGSLDSLPSTASAGLIFLQNLLLALDSLEPATDSLGTLVAADAPFIINGQTVGTLAKVTEMFKMRSKKLSKFHHNVRKAWDIAHDDSSLPRRTVMYESTSVTVFKDDPEQLNVHVDEFNIVELELRPQTKSETTQYRVVELKTFMDQQPVREQAMKLAP
ncbi:hypothetical protein BGW36DRAFT_64840 [Talaromyces proteolyticus]|uniref:Uncharacterized protein n=1 Tax=Talaromyces proteolyticus TaxID=1131652 RepID=A0AAD4KJG2_9EURO|nr:uncharacterized protein BGW36DRAFT_64840 [Talaromyces proteolyticus]KAH8689926.1 hypothetical protein BGW36DRAFT_64840 [Talaromyces proteolyticus]